MSATVGGGGAAATPEERAKEIAGGCYGIKHRYAEMWRGGSGGHRGIGG